MVDGVSILVVHGVSLIVVHGVKKNLILFCLVLNRILIAKRLILVDIPICKIFVDCELSIEF